MKTVTKAEAVYAVTVVMSIFHGGGVVIVQVVPIAPLVVVSEQNSTILLLTLLPHETIGAYDPFTIPENVLLLGTAVTFPASPLNGMVAVHEPPVEQVIAVVLKTGVHVSPPWQL